MKIKIERMEDLFDDNNIEEMIKECEAGCCHFNAANVCRLFEDWECIGYVEGYAYGCIGHAINSYKDGLGQIHYFDPTQEWRIRKGLETRFCDELDVVKTFTYNEVNEIFSKDGVAHLISVKIKK